MQRRDYLPETAIDATTDDINQRQRAIAAAEFAHALGRTSPCLRGVSREWHGFCLEQFKSMQESHND
jgi:hypothetical protein